MDVALIVEQWDQLVRVAASMKHRSAKTHDVMQRLVNASPADRLAKALTALGRAVKTTYLLRYIQDGDLRSRVQLQLNRGEGRHHLAKHLFWSQRGEFHRGDLQEVMSKASCLGLLSNAVIAWYVVEMDRIVATLRQAGRPASDTDLRQVWRLAWKHVSPNGMFRFGLILFGHPRAPEGPLPNSVQELRTIRQPGIAHRCGWRAWVIIATCPASRAAS